MRCVTVIPPPDYLFPDLYTCFVAYTPLSLVLGLTRRHLGSHVDSCLGYDLLAPGGTLATVLPDAMEPEKKVPEKKSFFILGDVNCPPNRKLGASLYSKLTELLAEGALKVRLWLCYLCPRPHATN